MFTAAPAQLTRLFAAAVALATLIAAPADALFK